MAELRAPDCQPHCQPDCQEILYWPEWAEALRCPDELFESAYRDLPDKFRVAIKTAIACIFFHFGQNGARQRVNLRDEAKGFDKYAEEGPAKSALLVFDHDFKAPARLVAPAVLASLCGVPLVGAFCLNGPPAPQILLALELCGVEDLFCAEYGDLERLLAEMAVERVASLGCDLPKINPKIAVWREERAPKIQVADPTAFDLDTISMAFGLEPDELVCPEDSDALFAVNNSGSARLVLGPGLEAFWLAENLRPEFFRVQKLAFKMPHAELPA